MSKFIIEGAKPLNGEINISGNKNAALPIICATLLSEEKITLKNVPKISDITVLLRIMKSLGSKVRYEDKGSTLTIDNSALSYKTLDKDLVGKFRGSILLMGPLLAKFGKIQTWMPGGCKLGQRPIDTHLLNFQKLGAVIEMDEWIEIDGANLKGSFIWQDEASVTGTENIIMASVFAKGTTTIYNSASEPHVQDLCNFLNSIGAKIAGVGSNKLTIEGVSKLNGGEWTIIKDHMEIGGFVALGMMTEGEIIIKDALPEHMYKILFEYSKLGVKTKWNGNDLIVPDQKNYKIKNMIGDQMNKIESLIWPGFPTDILQIMLVAATRADGEILIHEKLFEERLFFYDQLRRMGAKVIMCDPHRVVVTGPVKLKGSKLNATDLRAGMALMIAALSARGVSELSNAEEIDRGYENIEQRLKNLGAVISRE